MNQTIICYGESLWDILPGGAMLGGAPMNVAVHMKYNGLSPYLISRIGDDSLGKALLEALKDKGVSVNYIQLDPVHPTGEVKVNLSNKREVTYEIPDAVAWDYIEYDEQAAQLVAQSDIFIHGSLASRRKTSYEALLKYLQLAKLKVFDVNLRPPHYTPKLIQHLMTHADIVKMNYHELIEMMSWFGKVLGEKESMKYLQQRFNLQTLLISRGQKGAIILNDTGYFEHPGFQVEVEDTVGSGDAFLAAFLSKVIQKTDIQAALAFACATGACVATRAGALPWFSETQIYNFIQNPNPSKTR